MKVPPSTQTQLIVEMIRDGRLDPSELSPIPLPSLSSCLNELMGQRDLSATALAELSGMHRSSIFRILSEDTIPPRNVLLNFAFVMSLSYEETQTLLKCGECAALSGARARDVMIIRALEKKTALGDIDDQLRSAGHKGLLKG